MGTMRRAGAVAASVAVLLGIILWFVLGGRDAPVAVPPPASPASAPVSTPVRKAAVPETAAVPPPSSAAAPLSPSTSDPAKPASTARSGTIAGVVHYNDRPPVPAASVLVVLARGPAGSSAKSGETRTDAAGRFVFEGVEPGECSFSTRTQDEEPWDFEHVVVRVEAGTAAKAELWVGRPLPPGTGILVTGSLKYDDGRPVGKFRFELRSEEERAAVAGFGGVFQVRLPGRGEYRIMGLETDGEKRERYFESVVVEAGKNVAIVVPAPREVTMVVVDRGTQKPLQGARAFRHRWEEHDFAFDDHPNCRSLGGAPLTADGEGRIRIGRVLGPDTWYVVADGHAWSKVETDGTVGEVRVPLVPGGSVRVSIAGWDRLTDAQLSMTAEGSGKSWQLPVPGSTGEVVYEGIPSGTWTLTVRRGWHFRDGEIYGQGTVEVIAGQVAALAVETKVSEAGALVAVHGTVIVPASWGMKSTTIAFEGADETNSSVEQSIHVELPADGSPAPFKCEPMPPGRYEVDIDPQWYTTVEVSDAGGAFDFRLPGPGTVIIQVVDDGSGTPLEQAVVMWHADAGRSGYGLDPAKKTGKPGEFRIVAPAGSVAFTATAAGFVDVSRGGFSFKDPADGESGPIRVIEGDEAKVTVRMKKAGSVHVVFRWEGEAPAWKDATVWLWKGEPMKSSGRGVNISNGKGTETGVAPGSYTIQADSFGEEFEDAENVRIEVKAEETTEVVIPLVRKR